MGTATGIKLKQLQPIATDTVLANNAAGSEIPAAVAVAEQTLVGRITGGHIVALSTAQVATLLAGNWLPIDGGTLTGNLTLSTHDIVTDATTGTKFGTASTQKIGFYGATPIVRGTAFTQTYSTASHTHATVTQLAAPAGGTGTAAGGYDTSTNRNLAITSINAARTDIANVKQVLNGLIDDLQALGLVP
jgi:hypothetical protein